jgi:hypothetical protein
VLVVGPDKGADVYDPGSNTWALYGDAMVGRAAATATLLGSGRVLVAGGYEMVEVYIGDIFASTELFDEGPVAPTAAGTGVAVSNGSGSTRVAATFAQVSTAGVTTLSRSDAAPVLTPNFKLLGVVAEVSTTATFVGKVEIGLAYDPVKLQIADESGLKLLHTPCAPGASATRCPDGVWENVTETCSDPRYSFTPCRSPGVDTVNHVIYGVVDSLSTLVLAEDAYRFGGFLPPLRSDRNSVFKRSQIIPVKFQLTRPDGSYVPDAVATLRVHRTTEQGPLEMPVSSPARSSTGNVFRYDPATNQYVFELSTSDKAYVAGAYLLEVEVNRTSKYTATFSLR